MSKFSLKINSTLVHSKDESNSKMLITNKENKNTFIRDGHMT